MTTEMNGTLYAFPLAVNRRLVDKHAAMMSSMSPAGAESYLLGILERKCEELSEIGIDCEDVLEQFAIAIGAAYRQRRRGAR